MLYYFETAAPVGNRWMPNKSLVEPRVHSKQGKPDRIGNDIGPRVRGLAEVHPDHLKLTLDELAQVYGRDGRLYGTRPVRAADGSWTTAKPDPQRPGYQAEDSGNT
jgi:hypothetical protein